MTDYDDEILRGRMPAAPTPDEHPASPGESYYWDLRAGGHDHAAACRLAARDMGAVLASLQSVSR